MCWRRHVVHVDRGDTIGASYTYRVRSSLWRSESSCLPTKSRTDGRGGPSVHGALRKLTLRVKTTRSRGVLIDDARDVGHRRLHRVARSVALQLLVLMRGVLRRGGGGRRRRLDALLFLLQRVGLELGF